MAVIGLLPVILDFLVMPDDFGNDEGQEFLGEFGIEVGLIGVGGDELLPGAADTNFDTGEDEVAVARFARAALWQGWVSEHPQADRADLGQSSVGDYLIGIVRGGAGCGRVKWHPHLKVIGVLNPGPPSARRSSYGAGRR